MDRLPQPASRARAFLRAFDLGAVYPEGTPVRTDEHFYTQALAVLLEAVELARELRLLDYLVISPPHFESLRSWPSWELP